METLLNKPLEILDLPISMKGIGRKFKTILPVFTGGKEYVSLAHAVDPNPACRQSHTMTTTQLGHEGLPFVPHGRGSCGARMM